MSNIRVGVGKKGVVLALVIGVLLLGGGGGYLLWRVNQPDTVAPIDSEASGCTINRVSGDTCRAKGAGECNEDEAGAGTLCCKPYKKTCTYTLKYVAGTGGTITGNTTQTIINEYITDGSLDKNTPEPSTVTATPNDGFKFVKWSDGSTTAARKDEPKDATYTASFEKDTPICAAVMTYLKYSADANGTIQGNANQSYTDSCGVSTAVTAVAKDPTRWVFSHWAITSTGQRDTSALATANPRKDPVSGVNVDVKAIFVSSITGGPVNCTGFTLSCGSNNTININWNLVSGAVKYIARINKAPKSDWLNEAGGDVWISLGADVNSYVIQNAQSGIVYGVNVLAYDGPDGQTDFHPSCNMTGLGQIWDPPMYIEIACQGTTPVVDPGNGTVPDTGIFDNSKHTMIFGFVVLVIGLAWTWISTLPQKALFAISSTSSKIREDSERRRVENRRERLEKRIK